MQTPIRFFAMLLILISIVGCARRGSISGGAKDTIPPTLRISVPENRSVNFKGQEFKLTFDEYVKLKDVNKQLVVSPPMSTPPEVTPYTASKTITVRFRDTLQPNTTYSFNFGQSIEDNNESNPLPQFKYIFSTGTYIDSLTLSGTIKDAFEKNPDSFVSVMLYEANETLTDSAVYKQNPRYITNTLDSLKSFRLENLKPGKYFLVAVKDVNSNNRFDPKTDKIAFHKEIVSIPNDTLYEMELFREELPFKAVKATQSGGNELLVAYQGNPQSATSEIKVENELVESIVSKIPNKDSLQVWHKTVKADSLLLTMRKKDLSQEFWVKLKNQKKDSLGLSLLSPGVLHLRDTLALNSTVPITTVNKDFIHLLNKDSVAIAVEPRIDNYDLQIKLGFPREPVERYKLTLLPGAVTDYFGRVNDTISFAFSTKNTSDYGNLRLTLENVRRFPVIVQLTDDKGKIMASRIVNDAEPINFDLIDPLLYTLRVIYDENGNGQWDTGNFLEKRQAEEVIYFPKQLDVRANWDVDQVFTLP